MANRIRPVAHFLVFFILLLTGTLAQSQAPTATGLRLSRPARVWEFLPAVGQKAALLGHESGTMEGWVYPMKLFREFSLVFHVGGQVVSAESLVRTVDVHPEAATVIYAGDTFSVKQTFFVPRELPGAAITLEISTQQAMEIEARIRPDFQLMWPAAIGGTYTNWDATLHAFTFGEEQKKWFGIVGSSSASNAVLPANTNSFVQPFSSFSLGAIEKGHSRKVIVMAGSVMSFEDAKSTFKRIAENYDSLRQEAAQEYSEYLRRTTSLLLPDSNLQQAYDWSRVSMWQGLAANPFLGTGLVAGYRTSGTSTRPGFAWFFGRDSEWTSFALNSTGDFETTRTALQFIAKFQRQDGKIPHEISQAAKQAPWFTDFPYPWAAADATPLYIIAVNDYYQHSGDLEFVKSHWDNVWRAYQFLRSTWDENGLARNIGIGHGWIEGGPLLPVKSEFYQSGLGAAALQSLSSLARAVGKKEVLSDLDQVFKQRKQQLNDLFWNPDGKYFSFAIDEQNRRVDTPTVLTTVPMWFGVTDPERTDATITTLADADHAADWGMRIISDRDPRFDPSGYHFGSVWPLFTGWASVGEYRYHRPLPAYENLRANALLTLNGSAGHTTEVLSGTYFEQLSTSSPHQIWSSAMVVSPMIRGMLGIEASTSEKRLTVAPHLPGGWTWWKARNVRIGGTTVDLAYKATGDTISFEIASQNGNGNTLMFSPALSPRARVRGVEVNGRKAKFDIQKSRTDQHVIVNVPLANGANTVSIQVADDFALSLEQGLPSLGEESRNLKVVNEDWSSANDAVTYELAGVSGMNYDLGFRGEIAKIEGGELVNDGSAIRVKMPSGEPGYRHTTLTIHFAKRR